jgi:hypothetical protein
MFKLNTSKAGFSLPEATLITAAVVVVIVVGWLVYGRYDQSNGAIILQRQQYIDEYISHLSLDNYTDFGSSLYKRGYLTTPLYNITQSLTNSFADGSFTSNPSYATIVCIDYVPKTYAYGEVSVNSTASAATIPVKVFMPGSPTPTSYTAYWVHTNGNWQLNNVDCSQQ